MKTEEFKRQDGTKGQRYTPEAGDIFEATFPKVGTKQSAATIKGKAKIVTNNFLGVKDAKGNEMTIRITGGQKKVLDKTEDLKGKTIVFEEYEHKTYGKQVGARVKD